jgi:dipeptidyl aminopeptidase/acylaminoacyl peptidase
MEPSSSRETAASRAVHGTTTPHRRPGLWRLLVLAILLAAQPDQALAQVGHPVAGAEAGAAVDLDTVAAPSPTLEELFRVDALGDVQLSPDGTRVLYTRRVTDLDGNRNTTHIWLVPSAGGEAMQLTRGPRSDTRPRWRPDGGAFTFVSQRPGGEGEGSAAGSALFLMDMRGGEPERVHGHATEMGPYEWSPDGRMIAFTARDEDPDDARATRRAGRDSRLEGDPGLATHLWVLDVEARSARRLTGGDDFTVTGFDWSPDSRQIAFRGAASTLITGSWEGAVYTVEVGGAADGAPGPAGTPANADAEADAPATATPVRVSPLAGTSGAPTWSPDGRHIYYTGRLEPGYQLGYARLLRVSAGGGEPEDVSPAMDVVPSNLTFTRDGRAAFFEALTGTTTGLYWMPLDSRRPVRLTPDAGLYGGASYSADRRQVAFVHQSPELPVEVYTAALPVRPGANAVRRPVALTAHNEHARPWAVGRTEVLRWRSSDGKEVEGLVVHPAGWRPGDPARPLVTQIHGGPAGVFTQVFQAGSSRASAQHFAVDGYAVFLPNPRGSTGYGDAVQRSVIEDWGGMDFQDIMTGIDTLVARGVAHPDSLGVMGWSYGGYMTAWAITRTDRFRAAIVGAGITENISMWGTQDIPHVFEAYFGGGPYEPERWEVYTRSSPLEGIRNVSTPTLLIHGENDARVPPGQAQIYFRALRALHVPSELLWLPRTGHGPSEPGLQFETIRWQKKWMDRWIRGGGTDPTPSTAALDSR